MSGTGSIPSSSITKIKIIGSGEYSEVFIGKWEGTEVAIKQFHLKKISSEFFKDFRNETELLTKCKNPNIVSFFGVSIQEDCFQLIFEYLPRGTLFHNLVENKMRILVNILRVQIALDIARGLQYLHSSNIIHGNLDSTNILLANDWKAKISNFGISKLKSAAQAMNCIPIKPPSAIWHAPELTSTTSTKESDIWSLGIIFWELILKKMPLVEDMKKVKGIKLNKEDIEIESPPILFHIIRNCLGNNAKDRPSALGVVSLLAIEAAGSRASGKEEEEHSPKLRVREIPIFHSLVFSENYLPFQDRVNVTHDGKTVTFSGMTHCNVLSNKKFSSGKHRWSMKIDEKGSYLCVGLLHY